MKSSEWELICEGNDGDEWKTLRMKLPGGWKWLHWVCAKGTNQLLIDHDFIVDPKHEWEI